MTAPLELDDPLSEQDRRQIRASPAIAEQPKTPIGRTVSKDNLGCVDNIVAGLPLPHGGNDLLLFSYCSNYILFIWFSIFNNCSDSSAVLRHNTLFQRFKIEKILADFVATDKQQGHFIAIGLRPVRVGINIAQVDLKTIITLQFLQLAMQVFTKVAVFARIKS